MACFIAPAAEAVVMTVVQKRIEKNEKSKVYTSETNVCSCSSNGITWSRRLKWLNTMLWGGAALLMLEHIWHGEITGAFPFLTAIANGETMAMLKEIAVTGGVMAITITAIWGAVCFAVEKLLSAQNTAVSKLLE